MNVLLFAAVLFADTVTFPMPLFIVMNSDEDDVASRLCKMVLKDHGIMYRYETSVTRNGMVAWRTTRRDAL